MNPDPNKPEGPPRSIWHAYYINHYDIAWNPDKYPRKLSTIPEPISTPLPTDWEEQIDTFIGGVIKASLERAGLSETGG